MMELDWEVLKEIGVGGTIVVIFIVGFLALKLVIEQWKSSNEQWMNSNKILSQNAETLRQNTEAFRQLSDVFHTQSKREMDFQREVLDRMHRERRVADDTNRKVSDIHRKIVLPKDASVDFNE